MVAAKINSLLSKEFGSQKRTAKQVGVSEARVSQALLVLQYASELSDQVIAGTIMLNAAYAEA